MDDRRLSAGNRDRQFIDGEMLDIAKIEGEVRIGGPRRPGRHRDRPARSDDEHLRTEQTLAASPDALGNDRFAENLDCSRAFNSSKRPKEGSRNERSEAEQTEEEGPEYRPCGNDKSDRRGSRCDRKQRAADSHCTYPRYLELRVGQCHSPCQLRCSLWGL